MKYQRRYHREFKWGKVFKNGPSKICGRQPLKKLKWYRLLGQTKSLQILLKFVFHKFSLIHSWITWPKWSCLIIIWSTFTNNMILITTTLSIKSLTKMFTISVCCTRNCSYYETCRFFGMHFWPNLFIIFCILDKIG